MNALVTNRLQTIANPTDRVGYFSQAQLLRPFWCGDNNVANITPMQPNSIGCGEESNAAFKVHNLSSILG